MRSIGYNSQRDNYDFKGSFQGWKQCFSTCAWMMISYFAPHEYEVSDDKGLARYVDDVCNTVGSAGIGESIARQLHIAGNTAYWWAVHQAAIKSWLEKAGVNKEIVFKDTTASWQDFADAIKISPVILGTNKLGGLPGGHIILAVDAIDDTIFVNDPYGNANTGYKDINGSMVQYPVEWIKPFVGKNRIRAIWAE